MGDTVQPEFQVGAWRVEPNLCRIALGNREFSLQPRWMDVLVYLAKNAGTAVSADDIMTNVWGDIEVTQDSIYFTVSQLRKVLAEDESIPTYIETIAKRGYRLVAPVDMPDPVQAEETANRRRKGVMIIASVFVLFFLAYLVIRPGTEDKQVGKKPNSIAILPFVDLNPVDDENLSIGFADALIIELNSIEGLEIMARTSSFSLDARNETVQEIGHQLGVETILEGSLRREGTNIRVTAQLISTNDGFHIWADTYNYDIAAISRIYTDISRQVAEGLDLFLPPAFIATLETIDAPIVLRTRINSYTENYQESPRIIALNGKGHVVTWKSKDQDGSNWGLYGQRFNSDGAPEGSEFRLNTSTFESQEQASITAHPDNGFIAAWASWNSDGSHWGAVGRRFDSAANPIGEEFDINLRVANAQGHPSIAAASDGRFIIVFSSRGTDGSGFGVFARWFDAAGEPLSDEFQISSLASGDQSRPKIVALSTAGFAAIWTSFGQDGSVSGLFGQLYDADGNTLGSEFPVNTFTSGDQDFPALAALSDGGFVAAWQSRGQDHDSDDRWGVFGQRFDSKGARVGEEFAINSHTANDQMHVDVSAMSDGGFFAAWTSDTQAGLGLEIFGQRFDGNGNPVGAELMINVVTNSYQRDPAVAALPDGSVVVTYSADDWDGSYFGIFSRRLVFAYETSKSMTGKFGADTFVFDGSFSNYEIVNFDAEIDRIDLRALSTGFSQLDIAAASDHVTVDTGRGVIRVGGVRQLAAGHFLF